MIRSLEILDPKSTHIKWLVKVPAHSLFALNIPEANYIEMDADDYFARSRKCLDLLPKWAEEKPVFNKKKA